MKKINVIQLYTLILGTLLAPAFALAAPKIDVKLDTKAELAQSLPGLNYRSCSLRYDTEVRDVYKIVDVAKAKKAVATLKALRKDQDKDLESIFNSLDTEASTSEEKEVIVGAKTEVQKAIDTKRIKMDELLDSSIITQSDIEKIVASTLLEQEVLDKVCPINVTNQKDIRTTNVTKLKKLSEDKKTFYQKQTKAIQDEFVTAFQKAIVALNSTKPSDQKVDGE